MKKYYFLLLSISLLFLASCKDDAAPCDDIDCGINGICVLGDCQCENGYTGSNCEIAPSKYLKNFIEETDGISWEYIYDTDNNYISYIKTRNNQSEVTTLDFSNDTLSFYNESQELISKKYLIAPGKIRSDSYDPVAFKFYTIETYDQCGRSGFESFDADGMPTGQTWELMAQSCQEYSIEQGINGNTIIISYLLDNAFIARPSTNDRFFPDAKWVKKGNIVNYKFEKLNSAGELELLPFSSYDAVFEFDEFGYPTSQSRVYLDGTEKQYSYEYY